MMTEGQNR